MATETVSQSSVTFGILLDSLDTTDKSQSAFLGAIIRFADGSSWKIKKPLSDLKYQQGEPPFEARQVFECVCVEDPNGVHAAVGEAVMKVKFQYEAPTSTAVNPLTRLKNNRNRRNAQED
jgi:hypothetical protein